MRATPFKAVKLILVILVISSCGYAQLPKHVIKYVREVYPNSVFPAPAEFSMYWEHFAPDSATHDPWYAIADFTGDGTTDFALMIIDSMKIKYLAIHSDGGQFQHFQFFPPSNYRKGLSLHTGIELDLRKTIRETAVADNPRQIEVENPGIHVYFFETSSIFVYWKNNNYEKLWTSD